MSEVKETPLNKRSIEILELIITQKASDGRPLN